MEALAFGRFRVGRHVPSAGRAPVAGPGAPRGEVRAVLSLRPVRVRPPLPGQHDGLGRPHAPALRRRGSPGARYLEGLTTTDMATSPPGHAVDDGEAWRLRRGRGHHGRAPGRGRSVAALGRQVVLLQRECRHRLHPRARPEGAPPGTTGLAMFLVPKVLPDGTRNCLTINRLKDSSARAPWRARK